jgi:thiamine-monophosphate kinase
MGEFELIERYFAAIGPSRADVILDVGDDAALLSVPAGYELAACTDTLVAGRHFPLEFDAADIGWRALAVNLSDLAAMGAQPAWALLSLTLPTIDEDWLESFAAGFSALALSASIRLVGGDTTRGPLTITVQAMGTVPAGTALRRSGATPGDLVYVTGWPGDASAGLALIEGRLVSQGANRSVLETQFRRPEARWEFGGRLRGVASACIDISDGLAQDLSQLTEASRVGALIRAAELPLSRALYAVLGETRAREAALAGGDDYELLFTVPPSARGELLRILASGRAPACHCIGEITKGRGVRVIAETGEIKAPRGWDHFAE